MSSCSSAFAEGLSEPTTWEGALQWTLPLHQWDAVPCISACPEGLLIPFFSANGSDLLSQEPHFEPPIPNMAMAADFRVCRGFCVLVVLQLLKCLAGCIALLQCKFGLIANVWASKWQRLNVS